MANADFQEIPSNLSFGANQMFRRNSANNAFEVFTPSTGITIGTTPITSGANDRILFQASGNVSQSDRLQFNGTDLSLINTAVSTGGVPNQPPPFLNLTGTAWNGSSSIDVKSRLSHSATSATSQKISWQIYDPFYSSSWSDVLGVEANLSTSNSAVLYLKSIYPAWGGKIETDYNGTFRFKDLAGDFGHIGGLSFGQANSSGYNQFWANGYDADIRTHFGGKIVLGAGRPFWKYGNNAGNSGSEFVQSDLPITIGGSANPTGYKLEVVGDSAFGGNININDGYNLAFGTSTGTKIGTSSTEKIALWGGTPVTQRTIFGGITDTTGGTSGTTINIDDGMGGIDVSALNDALATIINRLNATRNILLDVGIAA